MTPQITETVIDYDAKVRKIVTEELELEPGELTETGHFIDDYDSDSLSLITVIARIEKELGVAIPKTELGNLITLKQLTAAVHEYAGASRNA